MSDTEERLDVHGSDLRKLSDLKPITPAKQLIVDASETSLKSLACSSDIRDRLVALNVRSCCISSLIGFSNLKNLQELDIGRNQLKAIASNREDSSSATLRRLLLDHNELSESQHLSFVGFPVLTYLDLSNNSLEQLDFISTLSPQLRVLKISNNKISNLCECYHFHSLINLEEIEIDGNPVTEFLSDSKFLVLIKAIILGKLMTVNGVSINERDELLAEALHFQGIRRFRPDNFAQEALLDFVNKTLGNFDSKQLESISSQQRRNSVRRATSALQSRSHSEVTPHRRPMTTPTVGRRLDYSSTDFITPMTSARFVKQPVEEKPESPKNEEMLASLKDLQSKMDQLFSLYKAQQAEITALRAENSEFRDFAEKQALQIREIKNQLSIVPTNMRIQKRSDTSEFFLEWDNHLQAMHTVKSYELDLGGENQVYSVKAPNRRVVIDNPIDGQKIQLRVIQRDGKTSNEQEFTIRLPFEECENKENRT